MSDLAAQAGEIESTDLPKLTTTEEPSTPEPEWGEGSAVSAEELQAYVDEKFAPEPDTEEAPTPEAEVETEPAPEPEPEPQPEPSTALTPEQLQAYQQFDTILRANPDLSRLVTGVLSGQVSLEDAQTIAAQTEVPVATEPPPDLDLDDPAIRHLYEQNQAQAAALNDLRDQVHSHDDFLNRQQQETSASLVARARSSFQQQYELDDAQMERIEQVAAGLQVLPALAQGFNPATGQYESPDTLAAIERALELAYWTQPETRQREYQRQADQSKLVTKRKQKLAAVSGNSGSVPRTSPAPQTQEGRRTAMIQEVASAMSGNTVSGD